MRTETMGWTRLVLALVCTAVASEARAEDPAISFLGAARSANRQGNKSEVDAHLVAWALLGGDAGSLSHDEKANENFMARVQAALVRRDRDGIFRLYTSISDPDPDGTSLVHVRLHDPARMADRVEAHQVVNGTRVSLVRATEGPPDRHTFTLPARANDGASVGRDPEVIEISALGRCAGHTIELQRVTATRGLGPNVPPVLDPAALEQTPDPNAAADPPPSGSPITWWWVAVAAVALAFVGAATIHELTNAGGGER